MGRRRGRKPKFPTHASEKDSPPEPEASEETASPKGIKSSQNPTEDPNLSPSKIENAKMTQDPAVTGVQQSERKRKRSSEEGKQEEEHDNYEGGEKEMNEKKNGGEEKEMNEENNKNNEQEKKLNGKQKDENVEEDSDDEDRQQDAPDSKQQTTSSSAAQSDAAKSVQDNTAQAAAEKQKIESQLVAIPSANTGATELISISQGNNTGIAARSPSPTTNSPQQKPLTSSGPLPNISRSGIASQASNPSLVPLLQTPIPLLPSNSVLSNSSLNLIPRDFGIKVSQALQNQITSPSVNPSNPLISIRKPIVPDKPLCSERAKKAKFIDPYELKGSPYHSVDRKLRSQVLDPQESESQARAENIDFYDPKTRTSLALSLRSNLRDEITKALTTITVISANTKREMMLRDFPDLLEALLDQLELYFTDIVLERNFGLSIEEEEENDPDRPKSTVMTGIDVDVFDPAEAPGNKPKNPSLQQYGGYLFNSRDPVFLEYEMRAYHVANILRNLSCVDQNVPFLLNSKDFVQITAAIISCDKKVPFHQAFLSHAFDSICNDLMDCWVNLSMNMDVTPPNPANLCFKTVIDYLHHADYKARPRYIAKFATFIANVAENSNKNEKIIIEHFDEFLNDLVDFLGARDETLMMAAVQAIYNVSALDWSCRNKVAQTPRLIARLVNLLSNQEAAPKAALALCSLSEIPSNRSLLLLHEYDMVEKAMDTTPAADLIASILFELTQTNG